MDHSDFPTPQATLCSPGQHHHTQALASLHPHQLFQWSCWVFWCLLTNGKTEDERKPSRKEHLGSFGDFHYKRASRTTKRETKQGCGAGEGACRGGTRSCRFSQRRTEPRITHLTQGLKASHKDVCAHNCCVKPCFSSMLHTEHIIVFCKFTKVALCFRFSSASFTVLGKNGAKSPVQIEL